MGRVEEDFPKEKRLRVLDRKLGRFASLTWSELGGVYWPLTIRDPVRALKPGEEEREGRFTSPDLEFEEEEDF